MKYTTEYFSKGECSSIAKIDAETIVNSTDLTGYVTSNLEAYYLLMNTWSFQLFEKEPMLLPQFKRIVLRTGLLPQIKAANHTADCVILSEGVMDPFFSDIVNLYSEEEEQHILQVLRFPKRFSPVDASVIAKISMDDFKQIENRNKMRDRREDSPFVVSLVSKEVFLLTKGFKERSGSFSNGAAKNSGKSIPEKVFSFLSDFPYWDAPNHYYSIDSVSTRPFAYDDDTVKVIAVPKSYKAVRLIAPEITSRQYFCQGVRKGLEISAMKASKSVHFDDQTFNQEAARQGSINGSYATIDLSHASDTVRKTLVRELFEEKLSSRLLELCPKFWTDGVNQEKQRRTLYMFATAGNAMTFAVETIIFLAIANAASKFYSRMTKEKVLPPMVFGDDSIVDTKVASTFLEFLDCLGFIVNTDKSFFDQDLLYRESCGVEYYKGMDMSSKYFPRKPILIHDDSDVWRIASQKNPTVKRFIKPLDEDTMLSLVSVISLQHRLYSCLPCREFLIDYVRKFIPNMTSHLPGNDCLDLWEPYPLYKDILLSNITDYYAHREGHLTLIETPDKRSKEKISDTRKGIMRVVYEEYSYTRFLEFGPSYDDELSELLKISTPRPTFESLFFEKQARWKIVNE